jgi:hypothetical protein
MSARFLSVFDGSFFSAFTEISATCQTNGQVIAHKLRMYKEVFEKLYRIIKVNSYEENHYSFGFCISSLWK